MEQIFTSPLRNRHCSWVFLCIFLDGSWIKNLPANAGDAGLILELGRSPGERNDNPLEYSCLGNPMDKAACWAIVHGIAESDMT